MSFAHRELRLEPLVGPLYKCQLEVWDDAAGAWQPQSPQDDYSADVGTHLYFCICADDGRTVIVRASQHV